MNADVANRILAILTLQSETGDDAEVTEALALIDALKAESASQAAEATHISVNVSMSCSLSISKKVLAENNGDMDAAVKLHLVDWLVEEDAEVFVDAVYDGWAPESMQRPGD